MEANGTYPRPHSPGARIERIYLDMDGVIVDFVGGALAAHRKPLCPPIPGECHIEKWLKVTPTDFWHKCRGHLFWDSLGWLDDGLEMLQQCGPWFDKTWLLSTPSDDPGCLSGKYSWLTRELSGWKRRLILACDKVSVSPPGALLIDDSDDNCKKWEAAGGEAILVPRVWNSLHEFSATSVIYVRDQLAALEKGGLL